MDDNDIFFFFKKGLLAGGFTCAYEENQTQIMLRHFRLFKASFGTGRNSKFSLEHYRTRVRIEAFPKKKTKTITPHATLLPSPRAVKWVTDLNLGKLPAGATTCSRLPDERIQYNNI